MARPDSFNPAAPRICAGFKCSNTLTDGSSFCGREDCGALQTLRRLGRGMDDARIRELSLAIERATLNDSVDTIERMYDRTSHGLFMCIHSSCNVRSRNPVDMWKHVHGRAHRKEH